MICPHCHKDTEVGQEKYSAEKDFDIFWSAYPRKVSKLAALKAWRKVALNPQVKDEIMRGLGEQRHVMVTGGIKYTPHAATWLNGRRWEDEQTTRWVNSTMSTEHQKAMAEAVAHDSALTEWERTELDKLLSDAG